MLSQTADLPNEEHPLPLVTVDISMGTEHERGGGHDFPRAENRPQLVPQDSNAASLPQLESGHDEDVTCTSYSICLGYLI